MRNTIKMIVDIVHVISFCGLILVGGLGVIYEIVGHAKFEQIMSSFGISRGFERVWIVGSIMLVLLIATYILKTRIFSD